MSVPAVFSSLRAWRLIRLWRLQKFEPVNSTFFPCPYLPIILFFSSQTMDTQLACCNGARAHTHSTCSFRPRVSHFRTRKRGLCLFDLRRKLSRQREGSTTELKAGFRWHQQCREGSLTFEAPKQAQLVQLGISLVRTRKMTQLKDGDNFSDWCMNY